jgi:hypothetical protein
MREVFLDHRLRGDDVLSSCLKKIATLREVFLDHRLRGDDVLSLCLKKIVTF